MNHSAPIQNGIYTFTDQVHNNEQSIEHNDIALHISQRNGVSHSDIGLHVSQRNGVYNSDEDLHVSQRQGVSNTIVSVVAPVSRRCSTTGSFNASSKDLTFTNKESHDAVLLELKEENEQLKRLVRDLQNENRMLHHEVSNRIVIEQFEGKGGSLLEMPYPTNDTTAGELWCDELEDGQCPLEPTVSFGEALRDRAYWLVGLLVLQSFSGIILARNEILLENHPFIIYFLTMLVGAGGNAGNQASVRVIRGLALGTLNENTQTQFLLRELKMACALSLILSVTGFIRASAFNTPLPETIAVTASLFFIVLSSVGLGAILPLFLKKLHIDPAHSSTTIQVIMDILGVFLAVFVSSLLLESPIGRLVITKLVGGSG